MIYLNLVLILGIGITLIGYYFVIICIGRFVWGYAFGAFSVVSALYVDEICPVELYGSFGAIN